MALSDGSHSPGVGRRRVGTPASRHAILIRTMTGAHGYVATNPLDLIQRDIVIYDTMVWRIDELRQNRGRVALRDDIFI